MIYSSAVRRRRRSPTGPGIPIARGQLAFEFYPDEDDARGRATSGQAFTKTGAPTLITNGYSLVAGDSIQFDFSVLNAILAASASPTGFTAFVVTAKPFGGLLAPVSAPRNLLAQSNGVDYPLSMFMNDASVIGNLEAHGDIAYNATDYEGEANYGSPATFLGTSKVFALRFERGHVPAPLSGSWSGTPGEIHAGVAGDAGRLTWFQDGVVIVGDGYAPTAPYSAEVTAGTILALASGKLYIGDEPGSTTFPRIGAVLIYKASLPAFTIAQISSWLATYKPVPALTMGPGDLVAALTLTNTTNPYTSPVIMVTENNDVAQGHSISGGLIAIASGASRSPTIYVRANGRFRGIAFHSTNSGGANRAGINFNLNTQALSNFTAGAGTVSASSITAMGENWWRLQWTGAQNGGDVTSQVCLRLVDAAGNATYNGDGVSGMQLI